MSAAQKIKPSEIPLWRAGHARGVAGEPMRDPNAPSDPSPAFKSGYDYGLFTHALGRWCRKHNRTAVYDGQPMPKGDPHPITFEEARAWLVRNP